MGTDSFNPFPPVLMAELKALTMQINALAELRANLVRGYLIAKEVDITDPALAVSYDSQPPGWAFIDSAPRLAVTDPSTEE